MRTDEEILKDEKNLIHFKCSSEVVHTEILLDIRGLLVDLNRREDE